MPVSFSTIEAKRHEFIDIGEWQDRLTRASQMPGHRRFVWSASILSMICWRGAPRVKRCVSADQRPFIGGMARQACRPKVRVIVGDALEGLRQRSVPREW
jgi:hypothetical protein